MGRLSCRLLTAKYSDTQYRCPHALTRHCFETEYPMSRTCYCKTPSARRSMLGSKMDGLVSVHASTPHFCTAGLTALLSRLFASPVPNKAQTQSKTKNLSTPSLPLRFKCWKQGDCNALGNTRSESQCTGPCGNCMQKESERFVDLRTRQSVLCMRAAAFHVKCECESRSQTNRSKSTPLHLAAKRYRSTCMYDRI